MMKKIIILLLSITSSFLIGGCDDTPPILTNSNLDKHINTLECLDTYVIEFETEKFDNGNLNTAANFIYVDNKNDSFVISVLDKENPGIIENTDLVFEYDGDKLYNYMYDDLWIKHEINKHIVNVIGFEETVFDFLMNLTEETIDDNVIYKAIVTMEDIKDSGYTAFGGNVAEKYYNVEIPIIATYSIVEERFISFEFDFINVLKAMDADQGLTTSEEDYWKVKFEYTCIDDDFDLVIEDYVMDDFIDDFSQETITDIVELYSYELIKGCVDYSTDHDLIKIEFETNGLYQLSLQAFDGVHDLVISILDNNHNIVRTFNLNNDDDHTSYWNYAEGTYYLIVSGDLVEATAANYSLIFLSN